MFFWKSLRWLSKPSQRKVLDDFSKAPVHDKQRCLTFLVKCVFDIDFRFVGKSSIACLFTEPFIRHSGFNIFRCMTMPAIANIQIACGYFQGRSQDFSKGGGWNYGSKSYGKEKLLVIRIARKAHILWINSWLYSPRNLGSFQLYCHLVSLIFFHDDRKAQPPWLHVSAEFRFDLWFFSTVGKHISHVHVFFIFAKFKKRIKLLCAKLVVLTCLMRL